MARADNNYAGLFNIQDHHVRSALKVVYDQLALVRGLPNAPAWKGNVHAGDNKLTNLASGEADTDAVTVAQLRAATDPRRLAPQFQSGGVAPINVTNLVGAGSQILTGTHADRLATTPITGVFFYETDRNALYFSSDGVAWTLAVSAYLSSAADLPGDLGTSDAGFTFFQQDWTEGNVVWWWTGSSWYAVVGCLRGNLVDIPAAAHRLQGIYYEAQDFNRVYVCADTAWTDATGQPSRKQIGLFMVDPGAGWAICDGSTVDISVNDGSITSYTTPDLITATPFPRFDNSAYAGSGFGTTGTDYNDWYFIPYVRL